MKILGTSFYNRDDVVTIARDLIGKVIITNFNDLTTSARIVETEAYNGIVDKASHAFGGRHTNRTSVMFGNGGHAYVYLIYGIHHLFNVVTNDHGTPHAVLIRGVEPLQGKSIMLERAGKSVADATLTRGPGNVSKALGINTTHTGMALTEPPIIIADDGFKVPADSIISTKRIGVDYAAEDAFLPYRFIVKGNKYVSGNKAQNAPFIDY